ncbi:methyltransferase [Phyllobacterium brassicacearum]|uniref:peptide chain release factor N(5)-glutamine methyltransferase n=1 Tax=Phyllobacterium brassicacearum TaxID=314235 RepID=A0A2P7BWV3_9HYPH|nr:HemK/PrmC family methyltransferase [Phyllobacterium brassicacearum]PSH70944.1 methyltransferase [Phyllobacterium brassicacearum]TDQ35553.1 release factor glutamine methyltransferase [Phyllobacterium brassicacearum]
MQQTTRTTEFASGIPTGSAKLHRFLGVELEIAPGVLVPREETELLGLTAINILAKEPTGPLVIDMCCGSGNLGLAVAGAIANARVLGADLTDETVDLARRNVERLGFDLRVKIFQGDLFDAMNGQALTGKVDMIICNPPYISARRLEDGLSHLLVNEPREAFDGGPFGISILQRVVRDSVPFLRPGGILTFEFGEGQHQQVAHLLSRAAAYDQISFVDNEAGIPRVAVARKQV